jgi:hypothetical protein
MHSTLPREFTIAHSMEAYDIEPQVNRHMQSFPFVLLTTGANILLV